MSRASARILPHEHRSRAGEAPVADPVAGERGIASVNAARSLQSRVSNLLAMGLMSTLGLGFLAGITRTPCASTPR